MARIANSSAKLLPKGAVLLTTRAPVGYVAIAENEVTTNQGFRSLIPNDATSSEFLYYLLKLNTEYLRSNASGTTFGELSGSTLKSLKFAFPPPREQRVIVSIIGSLDEKIELNQLMNKALEEIGKSIFRHWFIDSDFPTEKGKPYESSGGKMVYDEELGREIPKGWKPGALGEMCKITMGQSPPGDTYNEVGNGMPFYQGIRDFGFRFPQKRVFCSSPTRLAEDGDILLSVRAPIGSLNVASETCCIGRGVASIRHREKYQSFLYYLLMSTKADWNSFEAEGTVFGAVTKADVNDFAIVMPPNELQSKFDSSVEPLDARVRLNEEESRHLSELRNSLLPKLMSGKIRAPVEVR